MAGAGESEPVGWVRRVYGVGSRCVLLLTLVRRLGEDGGIVDVQVDAAVYEESGGIKKAAINVGSYAQDCTKFTENLEPVGGHRVSFEVVAEGGGNLVELWRLVDSDAERVELECELVQPYVRSAESPMLFSSAIASGGDGAGGEPGVSVEGAKISMKMEDQDSLDVSEIAMELGLRVTFMDGESLAFELKGSAQEQDAFSLWDEDEGNNTKTYDVQLYGGTTSTWKKPFGISWMEISKGSIEVSTTSDMTWEETQMRMQLGASFAFNATLGVEVDAVVGNGGEDVVLMARLRGDNLQLLQMLGMAAGQTDIANERVAEYGQRGHLAERSVRKGGAETQRSAARAREKTICRLPARAGTSPRS